MSNVNSVNNVNELKDTTNTKTLNLFLLTLATAGIFPLLWLYKHNSDIERITNTLIASNTFVIWIAVCVGLGAALTGTGEVTIELVAAIFSLASAVLYVVWVFKAKAALQSYALNELNIHLKMNGFYTFLFTLYYINYCINDLPEAARKQGIVSGDHRIESASGTLDV